MAGFLRPIRRCAAAGCVRVAPVNTFGVCPTCVTGSPAYGDDLMASTYDDQWGVPHTLEVVDDRDVDR